MIWLIIFLNGRDTVWINSKDTETCRCESCQEDANRESKKQWWNNNKEKYLN